MNNCLASFGNVGQWTYVAWSVMVNRKL